MQPPLGLSIFGRILERQVGVCWMIFQQVWAPGAHPAHLECSWWDWPAAPVEFGIAGNKPILCQIPQGSRVLVFPLLSAILTPAGNRDQSLPKLTGQN